MKNNLDKIKLFLSKNYLALIFALLVGVISVAPELLAIKDLGRDYQGIPLFKINDNLYYIAKIQDIIDGHFFANSPAIYEYKNSQSLVLALGELFYALPAKLLNLSVSNIVVFNKFLLPAILFYLVYWLVISLSFKKEDKSLKINAIAGGLFVTLGRYLVDIKNAWLLISGQINDYISLGWTRPVNPITGALSLFIFLLIIWQIINGKKRPLLLSLSAGLILGLMIYYFLSWGAGLAVAAVLLLIFLFKKEWRIIKYLAIVIFTNFLASLPFWLNLWQNLNPGGERNISVKSGIILTHEPLLNKVLIASLIIFLPCLIYEFYEKRKRKEKIDKWWWFCLALLLGGLLALNQQVITGRTVWPYHFVQYTIPLAIIALVMLFYNFIKQRFYRLWQAVILLIIISSLAYGLASSRSYIFAEPSFKAVQRYAAALNWLNKNIPLDSVVLTVDKEENITRPLEQLIPAFTRANVYTTVWIPWSVIPEERLYHNYLITLRLRGIKTKEINSYLYDQTDEIRGLFFKDIAMANAQTFDKNDPYLLDKIKTIGEAYKDFINKDFTAELKKYRLDYIVSEGDLSPENKKLLPQIKFIQQSNSIFIYKF